VAGFWTDEGEYVGDNGIVLRGRKAIEEAYAKFFAKAGKVRAEGQIDSIRFVAHDSAVVEGFVTAYKGKDAQPTSSRFSLLVAREDGRWRLAIVREWADEGASVQDVALLIGSWEAKTPLAEVRTTYSWAEGKKFIRVAFEIKERGRTITGQEVIGQDPRTNQLRSWLFESDGGFGNATWSREGKRWIQEATGVQADGGELTARNILTPVSKDAFTWQSVNRRLDGEELPDIAPVKVTRIK
jgi:uncharacterized protein (TIGR02246 family)